MAISKKNAAIIRDARIKELMEIYGAKEEMVMQAASNIVCFPIVDEDGEEGWVKVTISIPTGAEKGSEPWDGFSLSEEYQMKLKDKAEKDAKAAKNKEKKIAADEKRRATEKANKEKRGF